MTSTSDRGAPRALRWIAAAAGVAAGAYGAYVGATWVRYGAPPRPEPAEEDPLLESFLPVYDVVERHHIRVAAPPDVALAAARDMELDSSPIVRAIFKARELILGAEPDAGTNRPTGLLPLTLSLGWGILADMPGREVVVGAVTKPWEANVTFRSLPPAEFAAFAEPDYVKIAWTLRADPAGEGESTFRTETRAVATSASARTKFRRYWSFLSPGIIIIRWSMLSPLKADAERRARAGRSPTAPRRA